MKQRIIALLLSAFLILVSSFRAIGAEPSWGTNGRIAIAGDSITGAGKYSHYLMAYLHLRHPDLDLHIYSCGKGGTNVPNWVANATYTDTAYQYYPKIVGPLQPDFVLTAFGYNGSYTDQQWEDAYRDLIDLNMGTEVPLLIGPQPQSTSTGSTTLQGFSARMVTIATDGSYDYSDTWNSLDDIYTANIVFTAATDDTCTATAHGMADGTRVLVDVGTAPGGLADGIYWTRDGTANTFKLSATEGGSAVDITSTGSGTHRVSQNWAAIQYPGTQGTPAIHHGSAGHAMQAYTIIQNLGWGNDVSTAVLTAAGGQTSATNCTIGSLATNAYDGIDFTRLDTRLPWAIDEDSGRTRRESERMIPAMAGWQQYLLTVTGLTSGTYDVYINGSVVASVTHTTLGSGWNMSTLTTGPVYDKCQSVLNAIRDQQGYDRTTLAELNPKSGMQDWMSRAHTQYHTNGLRDAALISALSTYQTNLNTLDSAIHTAAQPSTLTFSLRRQGAGAASAASSRTNRGRKAAAAVTP